MRDLKLRSSHSICLLCLILNSHLQDIRKVILMIKTHSLIHHVHICNKLNVDMGPRSNAVFTYVSMNKVYVYELEMKRQDWGLLFSSYSCTAQRFL